ncbi:MAG: HslU--HslV peptidase ATPase subunit [Enterobacterales bacterium]
MSEMTPREIVNKLNNHIVGQYDAKRAVAIALRNRWRRMQLSKSLRHEITPKNILMTGPTGVGKTEIARRLAKLDNSPFIKVEATKFTEVGYVGKEVDSIIRELTDIAVKIVKLQSIEQNKRKAQILSEERILDVLIPINKSNLDKYKDNNVLFKERENFRNKLRTGELSDKDIEINIAVVPMGVEIIAPPGMEEMTNQLQSIFKNLANHKQKLRKLKIKEAMKLLIEEESIKLVNLEDIKSKSIEMVEQHGIVFIDEIDKICKRESTISGSDVSREGVQRDLLPLIEGCTISTKYGMVKTDHILFIASGSFQLSCPSDLIVELQGRLPIRVKLHALTVNDFKNILTDTQISITSQYVALMKTENVNINFTDDGIQCIAETAWKINESTENIGARRLHSVIEHLMQDISFNINEYFSKTINIDSIYVKNNTNKLIKKEDLKKFIL